MKMTEKKASTLKYFEYMRLAKAALQDVLAEYPELSTLSPKEMEVFELLLTDKTMVQIAGDLYISLSAVHFHCKNIYKKLDVCSRRQFLITYRNLCQE